MAVSQAFTRRLTENAFFSVSSLRMDCVGEKSNWYFKRAHVSGVAILHEFPAAQVGAIHRPVDDGVDDEGLDVLRDDDVGVGGVFKHGERDGEEEWLQGRRRLEQFVIQLESRPFHHD